MKILPFEGKWPTIAESAFIAEGAVIIGDVTIDEGASIWYNTVLRADSDAIKIGRNTNIQDNCTLHVDPGEPVLIGEDVTVGHGAVVHGCTIERRVLIGMNAVVMGRTVVGSESIIGSGTVIAEGKQIPSRSVVMGVPGKIVRQVREKEEQELAEIPRTYAERAQKHKRSTKSSP